MWVCKTFFLHFCLLWLPSRRCSFSLSLSRSAYIRVASSVRAAVICSSSAGRVLIVRVLVSFYLYSASSRNSFCFIRYVAIILCLFLVLIFSGWLICCALLVQSNISIYLTCLPWLIRERSSVFSSHSRWPHHNMFNVFCISGIKNTRTLSVLLILGRMHGSRGRAGLIIILYVFFIFLKKCIFPCSYTISSVIVACETRLTESGISPEPNRRYCKLDILE